MIRFLKKQKAYLFIGYAFLLLVHFGFKDYFYVSGIIFYAFPLPILILGITIICTLFFSSKIIRYSSLLLIGLLLLLWFKNYYFNYNIADIKSKHSIVLWNIAEEKNKNLDYLKQKIKIEEPETLLFVEAFHNVRDSAYFYSQLKSYNVKCLAGSIIVASKHKIDYVKYVKEVSNFKFCHIKLHSEKKPLEIIIVDVYARPTHNRKDALHKIISYAELNNIDIIAGDFNTPYESVHFNTYEDNYQSLRKFQNGFSATWPFGLPLLELDQIWIKKSLKPIALKKHKTINSDHAMLLGYFD
ncbi:MAG: endonuclease/exonuclease/phosphatase family protein [Winogradskyella sp.]